MVAAKCTKESWSIHVQAYKLLFVGYIVKTWSLMSSLKIFAVQCKYDLNTYINV